MQTVCTVRVSTLHSLTCILILVTYWADRVHSKRFHTNFTHLHATFPHLHTNFTHLHTNFTRLPTNITHLHTNLTYLLMLLTSLGRPGAFYSSEYTGQGYRGPLV